MVKFLIPWLWISLAMALTGESRRFLRLFFDPKVPLVLKAIPLAAVLYLFSPLDLVPDLILGLGQLDDLAILLLGFKLFLELSSRYIVAEQSSRRNGEGETASRARSEEEKVIEGSVRYLDEEYHQ